MKLLELFAGTGSVGNVFKEHGWEVVSLDRDMPADIQTDIMDWDYKTYEPHYFDVIWASPPCTEYSIAKTKGVRNIPQANEIVARTLEIIDYLEPNHYFIENPQSGLLKHQWVMQHRPYNDLDYCRYGLPYRKRTRIWNTLPTFRPFLCNKECGGLSEDKKRHLQCAQHSRSKVGETWKRSFSTADLYRIPTMLTEYIIQCLEEQERIDRARLPSTELDFDNMPTA